MKQTIILLLTLVTMTAVMTEADPTPTRKLSLPVRDSIIVRITEFTVEERVVKVLRDSGFSRAMQRILLAQARHESGGFTNPLTVRHNNIFAMQHPGKWRKTTSLGPFGRAENRGGFASFASIEDAVRDYILYKKDRKILDKEDPKAYVYQLKEHGYFEANRDLYVRAIKRWMNQDSTVRNFSTN